MGFFDTGGVPAAAFGNAFFGGMERRQTRDLEREKMAQEKAYRDQQQGMWDARTQMIMQQIEESKRKGQMEQQKMLMGQEQQSGFRRAATGMFERPAPGDELLGGGEGMPHQPTGADMFQSMAPFMTPANMTSLIGKQMELEKPKELKSTPRLVYGPDGKAEFIYATAGMALPKGYTWDKPAPPDKPEKELRKLMVIYNSKGESKPFILKKDSEIPKGWSTEKPGKPPTATDKDKLYASYLVDAKRKGEKPMSRYEFDIWLSKQKGSRFDELLNLLTPSGGGTPGLQRKPLEAFER